MILVPILKSPDLAIVPSQVSIIQPFSLPNAGVAGTLVFLGEPDHERPHFVLRTPQQVLAALEGRGVVMVRFGQIAINVGFVAGVVKRRRDGIDDTDRCEIVLRSGTRFPIDRPFAEVVAALEAA
jgi:hypothetical protein